MKPLFDPDAIRAQIANLAKDRDRIDQAIESLETALRTIEKIDASQAEIVFPSNAPDITLTDAVKRACMAMIDGITRRRVIAAIEKKHPGLRPKSASVAAALSNLTKGAQPVLRVAVKGEGRSPSMFSTQGNTILHLNEEERAIFLDDSATKGTGGWQSLWGSMLKMFQQSDGCLMLTPELRARLYTYYHAYGHGGWQNKVRRVFQRSLPHLFES